MQNDPGALAAKSRTDRLLAAKTTQLQLGDSDVRIGVASWTDPTLTATGVFYPSNASTPAARLGYYSSLFPLVEVDSSYYALPARRNAELWVERTPDDFTFNVKAFALMTGHPAEVSRLPRALIDALPKEKQQERRVYAKDLPAEFVDEVWRQFKSAIEPLHQAGKLGALLLQYPRWFLANRASADELRMARRRLGDISAAVEFRNPKWIEGRLADRTFGLLRDNAFTYVSVDQPQGLASSVPPTTAVTTPSLAMIRLHGRRKDTWETPGVSVLERFRYLYAPGELRELAARVEELAEKATLTHVVFNNCYANYGITNALEIGELVSRVYHHGSAATDQR